MTAARSLRRYVERASRAVLLQPVTPPPGTRPPSLPPVCTSAPATRFWLPPKSESGHAEESNGHQTDPAASSTTVVSPEAVAPVDAVQSALSPDDIETWEDFIESGATDPDFVSPALQEFKKGAFGLSSLDEFNGFEVGGFTPNAGEYSFRMDGGAFHRLLALVRCTFVDVSSQGLPTCLVRLSVSRVSLRVQAYDFATFCETILPLMEAPTDIAHEQPISFVVSFSDLDTAGQAIDCDVAMTYRPEQKRIDLVAGNFERPLIALPAEKFTNFGAEMIGAIDPTSRRPIDPLLLGRAIGYVAPAVKENDIQKCFGILELRGGRAMGGELGAVAVFTAAKLNGLNMRIRRPFYQFGEDCFAHPRWRSVLLHRRARPLLQPDPAGLAHHSRPRRQLCSDLQEGRPAVGLELYGIFGDGVNQAADFFSDATSIPSRNVTPLTTFGN